MTSFKNTWNKCRYTVHSIYYDLIIGLLRKERERTIGLLDPKQGDSILIVGAGTGADLPFLKGDYKITATDITPAMLHKLRKRASKLQMDVCSMVMDGQELKLADNSFDCVVLNLILAVIPDPKKCIHEAERVLKPNGKILVFDKFLKNNQEASVLRKCFNVFTSLLFTNINRRFLDMLSVTDLKIEQEEDSILGGAFRMYVLRK